MLLFLTFAAGAGVLITGNIISKRQEEKLRTFDSDLTGAKSSLAIQQERAANADERASRIEAGNLQLRTDLENATTESRSKQTELEMEQRKTAEAQERAAVAQLELKKYFNFIATAQGPRSTPSDLFVSILRKAPPGKIEVMYLGGVPETFLFANSILGLLRQAGWQAASEPSATASMVGIGGGTGLTEIIVVMKHPERSETPSTSEGALWAALLTLKRGAGQRNDESLPEDTFKLYIGPAIGPMMAPLP